MGRSKDYRVRLPGQRMQDVDGPAHVQALTQPTRDCGPRVQAKPLRLMPRSESARGIGGHLGGIRNVGQEMAVGAAEAKLAIRLALDLITLLVDRAVVPATEHGEIRERSGASLGPVTDVMALTDPDPAAREAAAAVAMVKRPP
jgi:hypothetical protein